MAAMATEGMLRANPIDGVVLLGGCDKAITRSAPSSPASPGRPPPTVDCWRGSTNAVVHLLAIAGRLGIDLTLDDFDRIGSHVPLLVDLQPAGRFLMDDFYRAGGLLAVLREVRDLLDPTAVTVTGHPLVGYLDAAPI